MDCGLTHLKDNMRVSLRTVFPLWGCFIFVLLSFQVSSLKLSDNSSNIFVERCRRDCTIQNDPIVCARYKLVRWLQNMREKEFSFGPFKVMRVPSPEGKSLLLTQSPRFNETGNSLVGTLNFIRYTVEDLITQYAFVYTVEYPPGARSFRMEPVILDEDEFKRISLKKRGEHRLFKKKKFIILPILILLNLIKLKLLLLPILLGVHFIKKLLLLGTLLLPSILSHLKICRVPHNPVHQSWTTAVDSPVDYPTEYGHEEGIWTHRNDLASYFFPGLTGGPVNPYVGYHQGLKQRRK